MKKGVTAVGVVAVGAAVFFGARGCGGFGLGGLGLGIGVGESASHAPEGDSQVVQNENAISNGAAAASGEAEGMSEADSGKITVTIREEKVTVNGKDIADKEELKAYIESVNDDSKRYELVQENAILASYNWVRDVFEELQIPLGEAAQ